MRILVDTGVFSASFSPRRRRQFESHVALMAGHQICLAAVTVSELRYGALVTGWGQARRRRLEESIEATTVVPVSDRLITTAAELRHACRAVGHPLHDRSHANDLWIAASAIQSAPRSSPPTRSSKTPGRHAPPLTSRGAALWHQPVLQS